MRHQKLKAICSASHMLQFNSHTYSLLLNAPRSRDNDE